MKSLKSEIKFFGDYEARPRLEVSVNEADGSFRKS